MATAAALPLDACRRNLVIQELSPYRVPEPGRLAIPGRPGLGVTLVPERVPPHLWAECS